MDLEQRVAALEAALAHPAFTFPPLTDEKAAELRERYAGLASGPAMAIPPPPPISPDEVRALLRECVTVLGPGDVLVIRRPSFTAQQAREIREQADAFNATHGTSVKVMAIVADEMAIVPAADTAA